MIKLQIITQLAMITIKILRNGVVTKKDIQFLKFTYSVKNVPSKNAYKGQKRGKEIKR